MAQTSGTRVEHDSMGEVRVPAQARYGAQTQRAVDNFPISGQRLPRALIRALGQVKAAAAVVHTREGRLPAGTGEAIVQAAQEVADGRWDDDFVVDLFQTGSGTSSNMNANEVIAHRAGEIRGGDARVHPNDEVNAGQSSNDVFPTAVHLAAATTCRDDLLPALRHLQQSLARKADEFDDVVKSGRTHAMDAVPVTLGQEFGGYARQIELGAARVESALQRVVELPLGGTAVGTGLNAPPGLAAAAIVELRRATGLDALREAGNHFEAQGARDALVELSGALKVVAVSLTKIAGDLRWMASGPRTGLAEIRLPAVQPGSSIMPAKVNPVIAESVAQVAAQVIGNDAAVTVGGLSGVLELNACIPLIARNVLESIALLASGCRNFADRCIAGIEADRERCSALVEKNLSAVTALVPRLGYERAAALAKQALAQDRPLREVVQSESGLAADEVDRLLDLAAMTRGGLR